MTLIRRLAALLLVTAATHTLAAESIAKPGPITSTRSLCHLVARQLNLNEAEALKEWVAFDQFALRVIDAIGMPRSDAPAVERAVQPLLERSAWFLIRSESPTTWSVASFTAGKSEDRCAIISELEAGAGMVIADLFLVGDGIRPRIVDFIQYSMPVRASALLAEAYRLGAPPDLIPYNTASSATRRIFQDFSRANVAHDYKTMESLYLSLPAQDRNNDFYISLLLRVLNVVDENTRRQGLKMLHGEIGSRPEFAFSMLDYYIQIADYTRAMQAIDTIEARFGENFHFDFLRMSVLAASQPVSASFYRYADRVLAVDDAHVPTYDLLLRQLIIDGRYSDAILILGIYEERLEMSLELRLLKDYENSKNFLASEEYKAWLKAYRKRT